MNDNAPTSPRAPVRASAALESERMTEFLRALRSRTGRLEDELGSVRAMLEAESAGLQQTCELLTRYERDHRAISGRLNDLEQQKTEFANMFVTCYRLHATLKRGEILCAIQEIVANLVGSEELVIFEAESAGGALRPVHAFGVEQSRWAQVTPGQGRIGAALSGGGVLLVKPGDPVYPGEEKLTAVVPLSADGAVVGAIAIFSLLQQKPGIESLDLDLLELLSVQAGIALFASRLAARAGAGE